MKLISNWREKLVHSKGLLRAVKGGEGVNCGSGPFMARDVKWSFPSIIENPGTSIELIQFSLKCRVASKHFTLKKKFSIKDKNIKIPSLDASFVYV